MTRGQNINQRQVKVQSKAFKKRRTQQRAVSETAQFKNNMANRNNWKPYKDQWDGLRVAEGWVEKQTKDNYCKNILCLYICI